MTHPRHARLYGGAQQTLNSIDKLHDIFTNIGLRPWDIFKFVLIVEAFNVRRLEDWNPIDKSGPVEPIFEPDIQPDVSDVSDCTGQFLQQPSHQLLYDERGYNGPLKKSKLLAVQYQATERQPEQRCFVQKLNELELEVVRSYRKITI